MWNLAEVIGESGMISPPRGWAQPTDPEGVFEESDHPKREDQKKVPGPGSWNKQNLAKSANVCIG